MLRERDLAPGDKPVVEQLVDSPGRRTEDVPLVLTRLADVQGVNALAPGQVIEFNPAMTVVWGENATGKSGYVRVLKAIAGVRNAEPLLADVTKPATDTPSASIDFRLGDETVNHSWRGEHGGTPLSRLRVFDTRSLHFHLDEEVGYEYVPQELRLFDLVADGIHALSVNLESESNLRRPRDNPFLRHFVAGTEVHATIQQLVAATDLDALERLAAVNDREHARAAALQAEIGLLRGHGTEDRLTLLRDEAACYALVQGALATCERFSVDDYAAAIARRDAALARQRESRASSIARDTVPDALEPPWRTFIDAAEAYIRELERQPGHEHYPGTDSACVYCRQPLSPTAHALLETYRTLLNSTDQQEAEAADGDAKRLASVLVSIDSSGIEQALQRMQGRIADGAIPAVLARSLEFVSELVALQERLRATTGILAESACVVRTEPLLQIVGQHQRHMAGQAAILTGEIADKSQRLAAATAEVQGIEARRRLGELMPDIRRHVENDRWADRALTFRAERANVQRSLTGAAKVASQSLLNQDFERLFEDARQALKAPPIKLSFPGSQGSVVRRREHPSGGRLAAVFSEGEQKAVALADFLAEAKLPQALSPVVFDDPVTSLDYKRMSYVVDQLVRLSGSRQVIVFTHNIWFTMELLARFEHVRDRCSYFDITAQESAPGFVSPAHSPRLDTWSDRKKRINRQIELIGQVTNQDARSQGIMTAYEELRGACEIVVEQDLLQRVVQSYAPNVMVAKLRDINLQALAGAIDKVVDIHDRCCRIIRSHRQPIETLNVPPTFDQLKSDWGDLQAVRKDVREDK